MPNYEFEDLPLSKLVEMLAYNITLLKNAPPGALEGVRDDLLEAADLLVPAAEFVEDWVPGSRMFLAASGE